MARTHLIFYLLVVISSTSSSSSTTTREQEEDMIKVLPGQPKVEFSQFSGYVTVNESHGRSLFYWLTESSSSSRTKPLLLWLNGGPGCSSIGYGASEEIGPFRIDKTGSNFYLNKFTWNTGHYVPQLAKKIYLYNKAFNNTPIINLKGFMVGNGDMDKHYDRLGAAMYLWSHAMISDRTYESIVKHCSFTTHENSYDCSLALHLAYNVEYGQVNQYSIYSPSCVHETNQTKFLHRRLLAEEYDPCTESYSEIYYNRPDVQRAMHANVTSIPYKWTTCNMVLNTNWAESDFSVLPIYKELIATGLRIWVFSGDTDSVVPVTGTRLSLSKLNLPVKTRWYPWYSEKQVGGWTEVYEGLTFVTVRGAGHEVPVLQPERALTLLRSFLAGKELPRSP
ncbi:putative serine carboxypeptidase-like 23 isoform X2 [Capsella rubella]|uniref:putative serine carboxypeptidase-like 23 isoform X2 n=1 Tax=Capsella rubella TaxID=81985 RepID=UPI000CD51890|nr:putative serine carboxypeptidase-like 23 isoform X2 [Capsella rubella]